jgi:hypothetical protein
MKMKRVWKKRGCHYIRVGTSTKLPAPPSLILLGAEGMIAVNCMEQLCIAACYNFFT